MNKLDRIVFLGSPDFAVPSLQALIESEKFKPVAVITQPDKPAGRNLHPQATPVKLLALRHNIPVLQPDDINTPESIEQVHSYHPDMLITVAYGQKLKKAVRESALYGAINLHPSLLPELRGAAPIPFALWQGMIQTGLSIFKLTGKMDAGPIYYTKQLFIFPGENATDLAQRLAYIGSKCLMLFLEEWTANPWEPVPQDSPKATYCRKLDKDDLKLNWNRPAKEVWSHIRALSVTPGAYTLFKGKKLKILEAEVTENISDDTPGTIISLEKNTGFMVQTADKQLLISQVQPEGKKIMSAWAFHLGARLQTGERLD